MNLLSLDGETAAIEFASLDIRVNAVSPGLRVRIGATPPRIPQGRDDAPGLDDDLSSEFR